LTLTGITQRATAVGSNVTINQNGALTSADDISTTAAANGAISLTSTGPVDGERQRHPGARERDLIANLLGSRRRTPLNSRQCKLRRSSRATRETSIFGTSAALDMGAATWVKIGNGALVRKTAALGTVTLLATGAIRPAQEQWHLWTTRETAVTTGAATS